MNEFPEGHVKVPSWEFVHFAHALMFLNSQSSLKHLISYFTRWQETASTPPIPTGYTMETKGFFSKHLWFAESFRLSDPWQARSFWQCAK